MLTTTNQHSSAIYIKSGIADPYRKVRRFRTLFIACAIPHPTPSKPTFPFLVTRQNSQARILCATATNANTRSLPTIPDVIESVARLLSFIIGAKKSTSTFSPHLSPRSTYLALQHYRYPSLPFPSAHYQSPIQPFSLEAFIFFGHTS